MSQLDLRALRAELERDEKRCLKPYIDTEGNTSVGVGRNLTAVGISDSECDFMLENDIAKALRLLDRNLPWWRQLEPVRQRVLANMAFNLEYRLFTFKKALAAMEARDFSKAAEEMLASKWAVQVGERAQRLAKMMRTGAV
ncbi:glycoside hydrolase family protein [Paraburkholderia sp. J10-1]|uniref:glycoside hydrolase family protein n=1 Tax=Paraburkholderia sp. J10-1 TaxID=2805430 RepID=UPI002AB6383F|nr:glycoside hydrolase family protein [Paraburkholderia sp. J10-1]